MNLCIGTDFVFLLFCFLHLHYQDVFSFPPSAAADAGSCRGGPGRGLFHLRRQPAHDRCPRHALLPLSGEHERR